MVAKCWAEVSAEMENSRRSLSWVEGFLPARALAWFVSNRHDPTVWKKLVLSTWQDWKPQD